MNRPAPRYCPHRWWAAALLGLGCIAWPAVSPASARLWQPLVLKGAQLAPLLGARSASLEVLAVHAGRLAAIPFQVDERLADGRYALPDGPARLAAKSPGVFDADDEVVFMVADMGERASPEDLPRRTVEVEADDPLSGPPRYAYIALTAHPRRSPLRYVSYMPGRGLIETEDLRIGLEHNLAARLAFASAGAPAPWLTRSFRLRVRFWAFGLFPISIYEADLRNELLAWKAGPVRVIRRVSHSARIAFGLHSPRAVGDEFFYRDFFLAPLEVRIPWLPALVLRRLTMHADVRLAGSGELTLLWSGGNPAGVAIGDAPAEERLSEREPPLPGRWLALVTNAGTVVQLIEPASSAAALTAGLFFTSRPRGTGAAAEIAGVLHPRLGYVVSGWDKLSRGVQRLELSGIAAPGRSDPRLLLSEHATPLLVHIRLLRPPERR